MTHIRIFCSPDADDLFMMWALSEGHIDSKGYTFEFNTLPTDQLNLLASTDSEDFDVIAISVAHYPKIAHRFQLLPHGGPWGKDTALC